MCVFSIIIPLYNKEKFIEKTLNSVLDQTFTDFEIIIVNDGSTDESLSKIEKIKDSRIKIYNSVNKGVSNARNLGIEVSNSNLLAFLDADDIWKKNHLEEMKALNKSFPNCGLYAMGYSKVYGENNPIKADYNGINLGPAIVDFFKSSLKDCIAWTSAVMIPKSTFNKIGYFNEELRSGQDTDMWIRIALEFKIALNPKSTAFKIFNFKENHLSISKHKIDRIKVLNNFKEEEEINTSLKKFLDLNRFSMAIERKRSNDIKNFQFLKSSISIENLNFKQRLLLSLPKNVLDTLKKIQISLIKINIYFSPF